MNDDEDKKKNRQPLPSERRQQRLKQALRVNLQRRKAQVRSRREGEEDTRPGNLGSDDEGT